ncbi:hypothetical protein GCM10017687_24010 [Streptomyces echinatus]
MVSQPGNADALIKTALDAGATLLKPATKTLWGYGGVLQAPDGTIIKIATSAKKNTTPVTPDFDEFVLLLGVQDVKATKQYYTDRGLNVGRSFGSKYVEFTSDAGHIKLALYKRRALAKDAGVPDEGTGSHRLVLSGTAGPCNDPDDFIWEAGTNSPLTRHHLNEATPSQSTEQRRHHHPYVRQPTGPGPTSAWTPRRVADPGPAFVGGMAVITGVTASRSAALLTRCPRATGPSPG